MGNRVGAKGQIVIDKEIRDQLGIQPGWLAIQRLVDGHLEVRFLPAAHNRSLAGVLGKRTAVRVSSNEWEAAVDGAWQRAASDKLG